MRKFTIIWLLFLLALSLSPLEVKQQLHTVGRLHDAGHFLAFFVTALLLLWQRSTPLSNLVGFLTSLALAFALEFLEYRIYVNPFEWGDIAIDLLGITFGSLVATVWRLSGRAASLR